MDTPAGRNLRIVSVSLVILALVWQHIQATRLGYEVERSRRETQALKGRVAAARMELETVHSPSHLAQQAKARLGMFPASPEALRVLPESAIPAPRPTLLGRFFGRSWRRLTLALNT